MLEQKSVQAGSAVTKEKEEKDRKRFQEMESLITYIFDVCAKETSDQIETLKLVLEKAFKSKKDEDWDGVGESYA